MVAVLDLIRLFATSMHDEALRYLFVLDAQALLRAGGILAVVVAIAVRRTRRGTPVPAATSQAA